MKTKKNNNSKITDRLPVVELSLEEQIETDGGGDRNDDKHGGFWDKLISILVG